MRKRLRKCWCPAKTLSGSRFLCPHALMPAREAHAVRNESERRCTEMRSYERPTLSSVGSFRKMTGLVKRTGPPDILGRHRLIG
ncbi:keywimysin-related RiPP [Streptomyces sp. ISL-98]|uniref:keywimysin-related RiPP n=1 Tax=Streptomyces sp. ISL-98 TaxID=2819192 RepID=UPI0035B19F15